MPSLFEPASVCIVYLGLDPGSSGGIAFVTSDENYGAVKMPETKSEILGVLEDYSRDSTSTYAVLEKVSGWIGGNEGTSKEGQPYKHSGQPGSSMFKFGASYGALGMGLVSIGLIQDATFWEAAPRSWQTGLALHFRKKAGGESANKFRAAHKDYLKSCAQQLFPGVKVTLATADALLIAEYCRRKREGKL